MSKKYLIAGTILLVGIIGAAGGYFIFANNKSITEETSIVDSSITSDVTSDSRFNDPIIEYNDDSGYSFSYPNTIDIKDVTPDDDNYYSSLELSKSGQTLKIDITSGNVDPYKNNKSADAVSNISLAGINATQYEIKDRFVTVAIDQGVLYVIDGPKDSGFWQDAENKIVSSFSFAGQAPAGGAVDENTTYEEEVVE